jgi:hypothetical protein
MFTVLFFNKSGETVISLKTNVAAGSSKTQIQLEHIKNLLNLGLLNIKLPPVSCKIFGVLLLWLACVVISPDFDPEGVGNFS